MKKFTAKLRNRSRQDVSPETSGATRAPTSAAAQPLIPGPNGTDLFPDGIKVLHDCPDATLDICFIHGLTGNRDSTWTAKGQPQPWPQALLPSRLCRSRILTYGYDAYVTRGLGTVAASNRLIDHASNLLNDLTTNRAAHDALRRPLILVAHSLGGLVCKEMILASRNNPESHLKAVFAATKGVIFMGTPHAGSWMADWASISARALGVIKSNNQSLLEILQTNNQFLESIQQRFLAMIRDISNSSSSSMKITCFYEELPLPVVGKVVSKESATFPGYNLMSIHANHRDMVRFSSDKETGFKRVVGELLRWETEITSGSQGGTAPKKSVVSASVAIESPPDLSLAASLDDRQTASIIDDFDGGVAVTISQESAPDGCRLPSRNILARASSLFGLGDDDRCLTAVEKCLEALNMNYEIEEIATFQADASEEARKTQRFLEIESRNTYQDACGRCLRSFSFLEMGAREASIEQPLQDTCQWIYTTDAYSSWDTKATNLLWIKGKPGSGKSTLMKSLCARRLQAANATSTLLLRFFFNARGADFEKSPTGLYLTLMYSLLRQSPILRCEFLPTFLEKESRSDAGKVAWRMAEIESKFYSIITQKQSHDIEILIDALDECKEEEVRAIIRKFEKSIDIARQSDVPLSVCWSSRHYPTISMLSPYGVEVSTDQYNSSDIEKFVKRELPERLDPLLLSIQDEIISRANRVFLWAVLVSKRMLKAIDQGKSQRELQELLDSIPAELDDLFDDVFRKIGTATQDRKELIYIAQWILCAFRPLSLEQLHTALYSQRVKGAWPLHHSRPTERDLERLRRHVNDVSGGLFEVDGPPNRTTRVQVIHETVREYFLSPKGCSQLLMPSREAFMEDGHKELTIACFRTLLSVDYNSVPAPGQHSPSWDHQLLLPPRTLSEDDLLKNYVLKYAFRHFKRVRHLFLINECNDDEHSLLGSTELRKRVLINFMKACLSRRMQRKTLPNGFNASMKVIASDPGAFGITTAELSGLITSISNLLVSSEMLLENWGISLRELGYDNERYGAPIETKHDFVAAFCLVPTVAIRCGDMVCDYFKTSRWTIEFDRALQGLCALPLSFVIAVKFSLCMTEDSVQRLSTLSPFGRALSAATETSHWQILHDLESVDWLPGDEILWQALKHDDFHRHWIAQQVCILFRLEQDGESAQKARFVASRASKFYIDYEHQGGRDEVRNFNALNEFEQLLTMTDRFESTVDPR